MKDEDFDKDLLKKNLLKGDENLDDDESGSGGESGSTGGGATEIVFRFPDTLTTRRDDFLSPQEIKRLLLVEKDIHKGLVDKQKMLIKERQAQKEGINLVRSYEKGQFGMGYEVTNRKPHPISNKAQFSGPIDKQMAPVPNLNEGQTNEENKNKLENKLQNQLRHQHTPGNKYIPKLTRH